MNALVFLLLLSASAIQASAAMTTPNSYPRFKAANGGLAILWFCLAFVSLAIS